MVELRVDGDQLSFITLIDGNQVQHDVGSLSSVRKALAGDHLTGAGVENAIIQVEDMIMPFIRTLQDCSDLKVSGAEMEYMFHLLPASGGAGVAVGLVESLYRQLADYATGSPIAWQHAATPEKVAVGLVVLREVMHHAGFHSVALLPERGD